MIRSVARRIGLIAAAERPFDEAFRPVWKAERSASEAVAEVVPEVVPEVNRL